ncbi:MAG: response regulator [Candidatus Omnitrophota bacterium]|jgi:DNA-binding response OmpR family regulator
MRILIIDDADESREPMIYIFTKRGFVVDSARNEREALAAMGSRPDIIIINSVFSEICGFEIGRKLKDDPRTQDIPMIFLSSLSYPCGVIYRASGAAMEYIQKPCDVDYLINESNKLAEKLPHQPI